MQNAIIVARQRGPIGEKANTSYIALQTVKELIEFQVGLVFWLCLA